MNEDIIIERITDADLVPFRVTDEDLMEMERLEAQRHDDMLRELREQEL